MRRIFETLLLALPVVLAAAVSCTENIPEARPETNDAVYLQIGSVTTSELTRAAIQQAKFPAALEVSIGIFLAGDDYTDAKYKNIKYTKPAGAETWPDPLIELQEGEATVYAYYPYQDDITDIAQIPVASSVNGDDWMWATPVTEVSTAKPAIDLIFNHALALVEITFNVYGPEGTMTNVTLAGSDDGTFSKAGTIDATDGAITPGTAQKATKTSPFSQEVNLPLTDGKIIADCLLVPGNTGEDADARQDFCVKCTYNGKTYNANLTGEKGVIVRKNTKSTILLNIKDSESKMEVVSVGVDEWDDKVSGNTAEVNGHTVTFNCPECLKYNLNLEQEASGSFDEQTSGTLKPVLTFSYDGSTPSVPQAKFLSVEGPASGCGFTFNKAAHTITVTDVTSDVSFNLSLGNITFIPYTATAKVEPTDKKIAGLPLNEEKSTFNGTSGTIAIDGELTSISDYAFNGNKALTGITLPEGITSIGQSAFDECHNLVLPMLPNSVAYIGKYAFRRAGKSGSQTTDLVLPEDLTTIERYAFEECRIKTLTGNAKLQTIWIGAFKKCNDLTAVSFKGETAPTIQEGDIFIDTDLTKTSGIAVPKTSGHATLFSYKKADWWKDIANGIIREEGTTVTLIPYTATAKITLKTKDNPTDYSWGANTEYVIDESASRYDTNTGKGEWFFIGEGSAVPTQIPAEMFKEALALYPCPLQSIIIPEGVETVKAQAFTNCSKLTSVSFPTTLTTIEAHGAYSSAIGVFQGCYNLTAIDLSVCTNLKAIPDRCFSNCTRIASLGLPEGLESIGYETFYSIGKATDEGIQSLTLPASLKTLGDNAFENSKVKNVILYSNLEISQAGARADYAFRYCTVETLTFEDGASPGARMFNSCTNLKTITSKSATPPCLNYYDTFVFEGSTNVENVYVPSASVDTYKTTAGWSQFADKIKAIGQ